MFSNQKHVFWQALLVAIVVFGFGIFIGFLIENNRTNKVADMYLASELELIDVRISSSMIFNNLIQAKDCKNAIQENINFGDRVYEEAKIIDKYEEASRITESLKLQHKKYDLLRALFWINAIKIKSSCNASYHNVVYFYQYNEPGIEKKAEQAVFSRVLEQLKQKKADNVMLIPIAGDSNISSINLMMKMYNIDKLPTILIDEKTKITQISTEAELEKYV